MQINPGGRLDVGDIVGRDSEIARYWSVLKRQGLVISAERRIGKTHIVLKMQQECCDGWMPLYQDLEQIHSLAGLARSVHDAIARNSGRLSMKVRLARLAPALPSSLAGIDLRSFRSDACFSLLADAFDSLMAIAGDRIVLLLWDEFPLMLDNLRRSEGDGMVLRLLDFLRALRSAHAGHLRFLLTGSVGLHLVLRSLRRAGGASDPVNDMLSLTVPPLKPEITYRLAQMLLQNTRAEPRQIPGLAALIADEIGGFPYHVHHVVDQLDQLGHPPVQQDVSRAIDVIIHAPADPAHLNHCRERLFSYYAADEQRHALILLNALAGQPTALAREDLANLCRHEDPGLADERLGEILAVLQRDHYVEAVAGDGGRTEYDFRWRLVKRWWRESTQ